MRGNVSAVEEQGSPASIEHFTGVSLICLRFYLLYCCPRLGPRMSPHGVTTTTSWSGQSPCSCLCSCLCNVCTYGQGSDCIINGSTITKTIELIWFLVGSYFCLGNKCINIQINTYNSIWTNIFISYGERGGGEREIIHKFAGPTGHAVSHPPPIAPLSFFSLLVHAREGVPWTLLPKI